MILGVGIDLCDVARMRAALEKGGFLERWFTPEEQAYIRARGQGAAESLAGHFAAKEAAVKALGCGIVMPLTDIAVTHDAQGAPSLVIGGKARVRMEEIGGRTFHLSITHTEQTAAAVAILEG